MRYFIILYFSCSTNIKDLWIRLRNENHEMLKTFEIFIENVAKEIKRSKNENDSLETSLQMYFKYFLIFFVKCKINYIFNIVNITFTMIIFEN